MKKYKIRFLSDGVKQYKIEFTQNDMPKGFTSTAIKWAHDAKQAVRLLLTKNPDKSGTCHFKRGATGKIISVNEIEE